MATIARNDNDRVFLVDLGISLLLKIGKGRANVFPAKIKVPATAYDRVVKMGICRPLSGHY